MKSTLTFVELFYKIKILYRSFSPEYILILWIFISLAGISFFGALLQLNKKYLIAVPSYGGEIVEGIIGTPRFINPVLATSDQDKDMTALVFAGLTKEVTPGEVIYDIAESVTISEDALRYTVILKKNVRFHDNRSLTADDVLFTIDKIQNPLIKSPHKIEWEGVTVEKVNDYELVFTLKKPFPQFLNVLSVGILPKHVWKNLSDEQISLSDFNIKAVGAGPYKIEHIDTSSGIPVSFKLQAHENYSLGRPYLERITIKTFQNERYLLKAFQDGDINRMYGIPPEKVLSLSVASSSIKTSLLPRTFTLFFNPNKSSILADKNVRKALELATDKEKIVREVLYGYGTTTSSPYPFDEIKDVTLFNQEEAKKLLQTNKTIRENASSTFKISLTTANTDEMRKVAEIIKTEWEKVGIEVTVKIYEVSDLNQTVIKERDFEILLFGAITQSPSDLYAFWHSSQRNYPGLNITNYVSKNLDSQLEMLRSSIVEEERIEAYTKIVNEFREETPGIFLFSPTLIYITRDKVTTTLPVFSTDNSSRFELVQEWYKYTDYVWPMTYSKNLLEKIQNFIH